MSEEMSFAALCSLFVDSLMKKAHAYVGDSLTPFQRSRLGESMTIEIRKLCDMAFPAARTPMVSAAARQKAEVMGAELRQVTWQGQKKVDGYQVFRYEHFYPVYEIRLALARAAGVDEGLRVLDRMLWVAWVTKEENAKLDLLKFGKLRPNPYLAYEKAGIELLPDDPSAPVFEPPVTCMSCAQRPAVAAAIGSITSNAPGRALHYCGDCRRSKADLLARVFPLSVALNDEETFRLDAPT